MTLCPRWRKLLGDISNAKGRVGMMVLAISAGIFGVGAVLSAYSILTRDISRNYLGTNPASALIELDKADSRLADAARRRPGIAEAEASSLVSSRVEVKPDEWMPILLFVVEDFNAMRINTFRHESGAWPPPDGTVLLEREALELMHTKVGDTIRVQTPKGPKRSIVISGVVHDPGLAPAWQGQMAYGYITPATLAMLGEGSSMHILKIIVKDQPLNMTAVERATASLAGWLRQQGRKVGEIRIPPLGMHPHQTQMMALLMMLLIFSMMALLLSAILTASMIGGLLAQQVRQIGIMKAVGARSRQLAGLYFVLVVLMGAAAVAIGLPFGIMAGRGFAGVVGRQLNFTIYSYEVPWWIYILELMAGILIPLIAASIPIYSATRTTVQDAINDFGVIRKSFGSRSLDSFLGKIQGFDRSLALAIRNTFRRRGRLLLTLGLLTAAGMMFMTSLNIKSAWEHNLAVAAAQRSYDLEVMLNRFEPEDKVLPAIECVPGVKLVEPWNMEPAAVNRPDNLDIVMTYPDGDHGSFMIRSVPNEKGMAQPTLLSGRRLRPGDFGAVVLNNMAQVSFPDAKVGDQINLTVRGRRVGFRLVGIVREIMAPAAAYVSPEDFVRAVGTVGKTNAVRVVMKGHDKKTANAVTKEVERALEKEDIRIKVNITETRLVDAQSGHVYVLIFALITMSAIMAVVGALGLMSSMGANVVERTREFGIIRTLGGGAGTVMLSIIGEGVFTGLMSWAAAIVFSLPLSAAVGRFIGNLAFRSPLPLSLSAPAVVIWLAIIVLGSAAASAYPAWKASRLNIRETLAYV